MKMRNLAVRIRLFAITMVSTISVVGCGVFHASHLDNETPTDFSRIILDEPPLPVEEEKPDVIPAPPADLRVDRPDAEKWYLKLEDVVRMTLAHNKDIEVAQFLPQQDVFQIILEDSVFDGRIQLGGGWRRESAQIIRDTDGPGGVDSNTVDYFQPPRGMTEQFRLSKGLRTGGQLAVQFGNYYTFTEPDGPNLLVNPSVRSSLNFELLHPLFQGHGRDVNTIKIRIARNQHHASVHRLQVTVHKKVEQTVLAYWSLYGAIAELVSQDKAVNKGRETWEKEKERLELGESATPDVAEARVSLEYFRSKQSVARKSVADAERALRQLISLESEDGRRIVPVTPPRTEEPDTDWEYSVIAALNNRPEIPAKLADISSAKLRVDQAKDGLRADVQAYASWAVNGSGGTFEEAIDVIGQNRYTSWSMGFLWDKYFCRRADRSRHHQAELGLTKEHVGMAQTRQQILAELHEGYQGVINSWHVIKLQRDRRTSAAHVLESRQAMYELGEISLDRYLRGLSDWSISMSDEKAAISDYNRALTRWEHAMGTILERYGVYWESDGEDTVEPALSLQQDERLKFLSEYMLPAESRKDAGIDEVEVPEILHEAIPLDLKPLGSDTEFILPEDPLNPLPPDDAEGDGKEDEKATPLIPSPVETVFEKPYDTVEFSGFRSRWSPEMLEERAPQSIIESQVHESRVMQVSGVLDRKRPRKPRRFAP